MRGLFTDYVTVNRSFRFGWRMKMRIRNRYQTVDACVTCRRVFWRLSLIVNRAAKQVDKPFVCLSRLTSCFDMRALCICKYLAVGLAWLSYWLRSGTFLCDVLARSTERERDNLFAKKTTTQLSCVTITAMAGCQRRRRPIKAGRLW